MAERVALSQRNIFFALSALAAHVPLTCSEDAGGQAMTRVRSVNMLIVGATFAFIAAIVIGIL